MPETEWENCEQNYAKYHLQPDIFFQSHFVINVRKKKSLEASIYSKGLILPGARATGTLCFFVFPLVSCIKHRLFSFVLLIWLQLYQQSPLQDTYWGRSLAAEWRNITSDVIASTISICCMKKSVPEEKSSQLSFL